MLSVVWLLYVDWSMFFKPVGLTVFDMVTKKLSSLFAALTASKKITESAVADAVHQIKETLLEADVPFDVVEAFLTELSKKIVGKELIKSLKPADQFMGYVYDVMCQFMGNDNVDHVYTFEPPATVLVMGLQGSGKTTTVAKLAYYAMHPPAKQKKLPSVLVSSIDFCRPAAIDQLEQLATKVGVSFYRTLSKSALSAVNEIMDYAQKKKFQMIFIDTAGRLNTDMQMLKELHDIDALVKPRHKFLVLDAMTGQESLSVAKAFDKEVGFEAAILSKMDSDARGGAAFSFRYVLKKPIIFIGVGEKMDELVPFNATRTVGRMLGKGDLLTLAERADTMIKKSDHERAAKAFEKGVFTLDDFAHQMDMLNKMGSLSSLMSYMPGMNNMQISSEKLTQGEREMRCFRSIIASMTPKERIMPGIIDASRKKRISQGAGVTDSAVQLLLERFKEMQQYVKMFKKSGLFKDMFH
jgi:signal recognition particle subunit SRP54